MNRGDYGFLTQLLAQPTAPFREEHAAAVIQQRLKRAAVPCFRDPVGNLVIGCDSAAGYRRLARESSGEPLRLFIAHLDHPGFHGLKWISGTRLKIKWHGGSPVRHLAGSRVWLATAQGYWTEGNLDKVRLLESGNAIDTAEVRLKASTARPGIAPDRIYGGFKFRAPVWRVGNRIYTKAADDLVGAFAIVDTAIHLHRSRRGKHMPPFLGLLTRAEEVGFIGAVGHFELDWLAGARRPVLAVSLETSRTLPGAIVGQGPVVRLGDRRTVFHPGYLKLLSDIAQKILPGKHQRRIMDGGTCEATAAIAYNLPAIGLSVPLGNYHNEGFEGGPDCRAPRGPAPEFVHLDDIDGMLRLCRALMRKDLPWDQPWESQRRLLCRRLRDYHRLLRQS